MHSGEVQEEYQEQYHEEADLEDVLYPAPKPTDSDDVQLFNEFENAKLETEQALLRSANNRQRRNSPSPTRLGDIVVEHEYGKPRRRPVATACQGGAPDPDPSDESSESEASESESTKEYLSMLPDASNRGERLRMTAAESRAFNEYIV